MLTKIGGSFLGSTLFSAILLVSLSAHSGDCTTDRILASACTPTIAANASLDGTGSWATSSFDIFICPAPDMRIPAFGGFAVFFKSVIGAADVYGYDPVAGGGGFAEACVTYADARSPGSACDAFVFESGGQFTIHLDAAHLSTWGNSSLASDFGNIFLWFPHQGSSFRGVYLHTPGSC